MSRPDGDLVSPFRRAVSRPMRNRSASAGDTAEQLSQTGELWRCAALQSVLHL